MLQFVNNQTAYNQVLKKATSLLAAPYPLAPLPSDVRGALCLSAGEQQSDQCSAGAAGAGGPACPPHGQRQDAALLCALRHGPPRGRLHRGPLPHGAQAAGVLLPLHGRQGRVSTPPRQAGARTGVTRRHQSSGQQLSGSRVIRRPLLLKTSLLPAPLPKRTTWLLCRSRLKYPAETLCWSLPRLPHLGPDSVSIRQCGRPPSLAC
jgi:hypothetical protein